MQYCRRKSHLMGDGDFSLGFGGRGEDFVGFEQVGREWLFSIKMRARLYRRRHISRR